MERVESQKQASHSFHEPLGNLAKSGRDSHIPTAPATRADGKVENQKQVFHFPTAPIPSLSSRKNTTTGGLSPPARAALRAASPATSTNSVTFSREATRSEEIVDAGQMGQNQLPKPPAQPDDNTVLENVCPMSVRRVEARMMHQPDPHSSLPGRIVWKCFERVEAVLCDRRGTALAGRPSFPRQTLTGTWFI